MKKLLVLALTVIMTLSFVAVSFAAATVTVGGEVNSKLTFANAALDQDKMVDKTEAKIKATAKVSDTVSAVVAFKGELATGAGSMKFDEGNFTVAPSFGSFKVGLFGYKTQGKVDVIDAAVKEIKADAAILFSAPIAEGFKANVLYVIDYNGSAAAFIGDEWLGDGAYAVGVDYANDTFGGGLNMIGFGDKPLVSNNLESAMNVNFYYNVAEGITPYLYYGTHQNKVVAPAEKNNVTIVGILYAAGALTARAEYDVQDHKKEIAGATESYNQWGIKLTYLMANGLKWEYCKKDTFHIDKGVGTDNYIKAIVSF